MAEETPHPSRWEARLPFFYGWVVVGSAFVTHFVQVGIQLWALSVFVGPMIDELSTWDRSDIFGPVTVRTFISAVGVPLVGRYMDRRGGAMWLSAFASGLGGVVLILVSRVQEPWEFMLLYGVIGGIAWVGQTNIVAAAILPKWFVRRRSLAMAVGTTGGGAGALVLPLVAAGTIAWLGWRDAWVLYGVLTIVIGVPLAFLLKRQPEDIGMGPDGDPVAPRAEGQRPRLAGYTVGEALRMPTTWLLVGAVFMASLASVGIPANMVPLFVDRGFSQAGGALALSVYGLMSVSGRYVWGYAAAKVGVRNAFLLLVAFAVVVMALLAAIETGKAALLLLAAASGLAIGGMIVLNPLLWPAYLGRAHLGAIQGVVYPIYTLSLAAGPLVLSESFDRSGSYVTGIWIIAVSYVLAFGFMAMVRPPQPVPERS